MFQRLYTTVEQSPMLINLIKNLSKKLRGKIYL